MPDQLSGTIESIRGPYNGNWAILTITPGRHTVVGAMPSWIQTGAFCEFLGKWKEHAKYGRQFAADTVKVSLPRSLQGIREYLSRHFPHIGPEVSKRIVQTFGDDTFRIMRERPEALAAVNGVTVDRAMEIYEKFMEIDGRRERDVFFAENGITPNLQAKLENIYEPDEIMELLKTNPYRLIDDVYGIGWATADKIAMRIGIKKNSPFRIRAGLFHTLSAAALEGHTFLPDTDMMGKSAEILNVSGSEIADVLDENGLKGYIRRIGSGWQMPEMSEDEKLIAERLNKVLSTGQVKTMRELTPKDLSNLDRDQLQAVHDVFNHKILLIVGGPGVGKTFTLNMILKALGGHVRVGLASPTGKAAKRMTEATGREAKTIHRLLGYHPERGWHYDLNNRLPLDVAVIDEISMADTYLMARLLSAVPDKATLIFVGDSDQLPSVGAGKVLTDMISSRKFPVAKLKTLHRQDKLSMIHVNAHKINSGQPIVVSPDSDMNQDFWFLPAETPETVRDKIIASVNRLIERGYDLDDIQVLCPQKRGEIGTGNMNLLLREIYNNKQGVRLSGTPFSSGDRVIQCKNNYDLGIFNGDVGVCIGTGLTDKGKTAIKIKFGKDMVDYPVEMADNLQLAYALTIHKSQGSEYPAVIVPVHTTNWIMLKRNLLYTAVSRAKKICVLVGTMKAINIAIKTPDTSVRYSKLGEMLLTGLQMGKL